MKLNALRCFVAMVAADDVLALLPRSFVELRCLATPRSPFADFP